MDLIHYVKQKIIGSKPDSQDLCGLHLITVGTLSQDYI